MASIFKPTFTKTDPATGKRVRRRSSIWWIEYRHAGVLRRVAGYRDKEATRAKATDLERRAAREAEGLVDPFEEHAKRPLLQHLVDFEESLRAKAVSEPQVKLVVGRCRKIVDTCKFRFICDLSASRVQTCLAELRDGGASMQTSNHYLRAIKQFTRWLVRDRRTNEDRLTHLAGGNVKLDRRHDRRALSNQETTRLFVAADAGPVVRRMSGPERAMLYRVAVYSGLRASELASLTADSFDLDGDPPTVVVEAGYSKHRRRDVLPVHPDLVQALRRWLAQKPAGSPLWPGNWAKGKESRCHAKSRSGGRWSRLRRRIGTICRLPFATAFITRLALANVAPKLAQTLARHSDVNLTLSRYSHVGVFDQSAALASVPAIGKDDPDDQKDSPGDPQVDRNGRFYGRTAPKSACRSACRSNRLFGTATGSD